MIWHFRFYTNKGAIVSTVEAESKKDAEGKAWAQVLRNYPDAIHHRTELLDPIPNAPDATQNKQKPKTIIQLERGIKWLKSDARG